jgi:hypothetical protein
VWRTRENESADRGANYVQGRHVFRDYTLADFAPRFKQTEEYKLLFRRGSD